MRQLVIQYDDAGNILQAGVHDVLNAATWQADGFLVYEDGRERPVDVGHTLLYDPSQPATTDILAWWRDGKYYVENGDIYEVADWTPPVPPVVAEGGEA